MHEVSISTLRKEKSKKIITNLSPQMGKIELPNLVISTKKKSKPGLLVLVALSWFKGKRSCNTNSGPLHVFRFVIATSPPGISARLSPLTYKYNSHYIGKYYPT